MSLIERRLSLSYASLPQSKPIPQYRRHSICIGDLNRANDGLPSFFFDSIASAAQGVPAKKQRTPEDEEYQTGLATRLYEECVKVTLTSSCGPHKSLGQRFFGSLDRNIREMHDCNEPAAYKDVLALALSEAQVDSTLEGSPGSPAQSLHFTDVVAAGKTNLKLPPYLRLATPQPGPRALLTSLNEAMKTEMPRFQPQRQCTAEDEEHTSAVTMAIKEDMPSFSTRPPPSPEEEESLEALVTAIKEDLHTVPSFGFGMPSVGTSEDEERLEALQVALKEDRVPLWTRVAPCLEDEERLESLLVALKEDLPSATSRDFQPTVEDHEHADAVLVAVKEDLPRSPGCSSSPEDEERVEALMVALKEDLPSFGIQPGRTAEDEEWEEASVAADLEPPENEWVAAMKAAMPRSPPGVQPTMEDTEALEAMLVDIKEDMPRNWEALEPRSVLLSLAEPTGEDEERLDAVLAALKEDMPCWRTPSQQTIEDAEHDEARLVALKEDFSSSGRPSLAVTDEDQERLEAVMTAVKEDMPRFSAVPPSTPDEIERLEGLVVSIKEGIRLGGMPRLAVALPRSAEDEEQLEAMMTSIKEELPRGLAAWAAELGSVVMVEG